jgi:hypothetical protein
MTGIGKLYIHVHTDMRYVEVKVKFNLEQAMKAHRGRRGIPLFFLLPRP